MEFWESNIDQESNLKVTPCNNRAVLNPCTLDNYKYQIDPYIGCEHYCYYCYVLDQAETDWMKEIMVHTDLVDRLKKALSDIPPQTIYLGWHTDPYQPCEKAYRQTRQVLELLLDNGFSAGILTKSDLVLRDMDILQSMENAAVSVSVAFTDDDVRRLFEANTVETGARIAALRKLKAAGIRTSALICPIMPYITDVKALIDLLADDTEKIWFYSLSILEKADKNWQNLERILETHFPELKRKIEAVVFSKSHDYWNKLRKELLKLQEERELNFIVRI